MSLLPENATELPKTDLLLDFVSFLKVKNNNQWDFSNQNDEMKPFEFTTKSFDELYSFIKNRMIVSQFLRFYYPFNLESYRLSFFQIFFNLSYSDSKRIERIFFDATFYDSDPDRITPSMVADAIFDLCVDIHSMQV